MELPIHIVFGISAGILGALVARKRFSAPAFLPVLAFVGYNLYIEICFAINKLVVEGTFIAVIAVVVGSFVAPILWRQWREKECQGQN